MMKFLWTLFILNIVKAGPSLCPDKCECDVKGKIYDCTNSDLEGIPIFLHPEMRVLKIRNNKISKLEDAVNIYTKLEILDLSQNKFRHLGKFRFSECEELQNLNLSNNFIANIKGPEAFEGPKAMQTLDLSKNTLNTLENDSFLPLATLVELRLSHNKLNTIQSGAFSGLSSLRVLHLDHNLVSEINPLWFEPLENLRFLYLSSNLLRTLSPNTFRPLKALQILDLGQNQIHNISEDAFYALRNVDTLNLSENLLPHVPNLALVMKNLANLDLSANPLKTLNRHSFAGMYALKSVRLDRMYQLISLDLHTFVENMQLSHLSLANNQNLKPLPWGLFNSNSALEKVDFSNNSWQTLSPYQIPLGSIRNLDLSGIPFYCNCSLTWLWELYQQPENSAKLSPAHCASLSNSAEENIDLKLVKVDDLACANWTFVLLVASISLLVTVFTLVLLALIAYKCKQKHHDASPCLHIKDDTMIYTRPTQIHEELTYQKAFLPQNEAYQQVQNEPFYEVPKFHESSTGSSSKYSSSGYVGSELWENDFLGMNSVQHFATTQRSSGSSSTNSSSISKPVFFSPARNGSHLTLLSSANNSPKYHNQMYKYVVPPSQQHHLIAGTNIRSPKGNPRSNVYV